MCTSREKKMVNDETLLDLLAAFPRRAAEHLLARNAQRFRGGLVFKVHRRLQHSTLGFRMIKKKNTCSQRTCGAHLTSASSSSVLLSSLELSDTKVYEP